MSSEKADSTVIQRVLRNSALSLESTALRLRRLRQSAEPRPAGATIAPTPSAARERSPPAAVVPDAAADKSGRVAHDARGNAVWKWAVSAGVNALESTSLLLRRLEAPELSLDDKPANPQQLELEKRDAGGGYDPYGPSAPRRRKP
jgi:hypothetical protein